MESRLEKKAEQPSMNARYAQSSIKEEDEKCYPHEEWNYDENESEEGQYFGSQIYQYNEEAENEEEW